MTFLSNIWRRFGFVLFVGLLAGGGIPPAVAAAEGQAALTPGDPCSLERALSDMQSAQEAAAARDWPKAAQTYRVAENLLIDLAGRCPPVAEKTRALLAELYVRKAEVQSGLHRSHCQPAMDAAMAQDHRAAALQIEKKDWAEVEKQFGLAEQAWAAAAGYCQGENLDTARRNQTDSARARAKAGANARQVGCDPAQTDAGRLMDLAKAAWNEKQWEDAGLWYRKAAMAWGAAADKCQGGRREQALKKKDSALVDAHNAVSCAPAWEQANEALSRVKSLPQSAVPEERRALKEKLERAWGQAASACRGAPQETARNNAEALARERGGPPLALKLEEAAPGQPAPTSITKEGPVAAVAEPIPSGFPPVSAAAAAVPVPVPTLSLVPVQRAAVSPLPTPTLERPARPVEKPAEPAVAPTPASQEVDSASETINIKVGDTTFAGQFRRDPSRTTLSGSGKVRWDNGDEYEGPLVLGKFEGRGAMRWASGEHYEGEWKNDRQQGTGRMRFLSGDVFEGEFAAGVPEGRGKYHFTGRGDRYEGEMHLGKPDGRGTYFWKNGDRFEGYWKMGRKHGPGRYTWASGESQEGQYRDDVKLEPSASQ